ncbi:uncharacterized protein B0T23DRAFT_218963 [Neurospora hispaniola]|uniref:Uncharacterized protein n=1 Tax=Neurospora hispaniola TaxID=588809 RepID=A0AAJ0I281_9PEZI|nr:hypothetical protein B0T23DRAFT_218963 [Neurospora hispaniola]
MTSLPVLTTTPTRHPTSCASLSLPLLSLLNRVLPSNPPSPTNPPTLTLSIGSGPGLLEALFLHHYPSRSSSFYGVEVAPPLSQLKEGKEVNTWLPEQNAITVPGTWALVGREWLEETGGLLFVYPRSGVLVGRYLAEMEEIAAERGKGLEVVVWIGPWCDVEEYRAVLEGWGVREDLTEKEEGSGKLVEEGEVVLVYKSRRRE